MPIQMGTYIAHVMMTALITSALLDYLNHWALAVAMLVMVIYLLLFRLTLPYAVVRRDPEGTLLKMLPFFDHYARFLSPVIGVLKRRAVPESVDAAADAKTSAEMPQAPVHEQDEMRLSTSLLRFSERLVRDVLTPRPDIVAIEATASVDDLRRVMRETRVQPAARVRREPRRHRGDHHRARPRRARRGCRRSHRPLMRPALLVPETKKAADLLKEFQAKHTTFALAIDEYGGTAGVVTVEDIVEELVGEIKDEYDVEAEPIALEPDGSYMVSGRVKWIASSRRSRRRSPTGRRSGPSAASSPPCSVASRGRGAHRPQRLQPRGRRRRAQARESRARAPAAPGRHGMMRAGFVAVVGRPNVGKSTLVNRSSARRSRSSPTSPRPRATASWPWSTSPAARSCSSTPPASTSRSTG